MGNKLNRSRRNMLGRVLVILLVALTIGALFWGATNDLLIGGVSALMSAIFLFFLGQIAGQKEHALPRFDQQGFMQSLNLSDKTAIFDGSNIYHFGLENEVGRAALGRLVEALRTEGFRIICFFDANIYFTLRDNGEFKRNNKRFSISILMAIFGLEADEIYVVPSGAQADLFILETLSHLPVSFAVTNDRFRDYQNKYEFLKTDNQWRKGVWVKGGALMLYKHTFKNPVKLK